MSFRLLPQQTFQLPSLFLTRKAYLCLFEKKVNIEALSLRSLSLQGAKNSHSLSVALRWIGWFGGPEGGALCVAVTAFSAWFVRWTDVWSRSFPLSDLNQRINQTITNTADADVTRTTSGVAQSWWPTVKHKQQKNNNNKRGMSKVLQNMHCVCVCLSDYFLLTIFTPT